jgi:hypothetical protein
LQVFSRSRRLVYNLVGGKGEAFGRPSDSQLLYVFRDHEGRLAPGHLLFLTYFAFCAQVLIPWP